MSREILCTELPGVRSIAKVHLLLETGSTSEMEAEMQASSAVTALTVRRSAFLRSIACSEEVRLVRAWNIFNRECLIRYLRLSLGRHADRALSKGVELLVEAQSRTLAGGGKCCDTRDFAVSVD